MIDVRLMSSTTIRLLVVGIGATASAQVAYRFENWGGENFGVSVACAGDFDGDGFPEILAGGSRIGRLEGDEPTSGVVRLLSGATGEVLRTIEGRAPGDRFGATVAGPGDLSGDGVPDFVVMAQGSWHDLEPAHLGYLVALSGADASELWSLDAEKETLLGWRIEGSPDLDGDRTPDLVVAYTPTNAGRKSWSVRVLSGKTGTILHETSGDKPHERYGWDLCLVGDVNGDARVDHAVGAPNPNCSGYVSIRSGADGAELRRFSSVREQAFFGWRLAGGQDVTGDGRVDLAIGYREFFGAAHALAFFTAEDGSPVQELHGTEAFSPEGACIFLPDVDGDGVADVLHGGTTGGGLRIDSLAGSPKLLRSFAGDTTALFGCCACVLPSFPSSRLAIGAPSFSSGAGSPPPTGSGPRLRRRERRRGIPRRGAVRGRIATRDPPSVHHE